MSDEPASDDTDTEEQNQSPAGPPEPRTPSTESVDLAGNMGSESDDEPDVHPEVLEAMEEGKKQGTIREVDDPLEPPDDEEFESGEDVQAEIDPDEADESIPNVSGEELDFDGLAESDGEEEWTWGEPKPSRTFMYKGMQVVMTEPQDDDEILNLMRQRSMEPGDEEEMTQLDRLKVYAQLVVQHPEITDERWQEKMTPTERLTIGTMAANYIEGEDFTTAPEGGQPPQPE